MKILNSIRINRQVGDVWRILGEEFATPHIWASDITHAEAIGSPIAGEACDARSCNIKGMGKTKEKVTKFDPVQHELTYEVSEGFPFFVKRGGNHWKLEAHGSGTLVQMHATIETSGVFGAMLAPMMKLQMRGMLGRIGEELKYYAETGQPHPRKLRAMSAR